MSYKFRGESINSGKLVYGDLIQSKVFADNLLDSYILEKAIMPLGSMTTPTKKFIPVITKTVSQYTGKNDKNGNEIYYSDIFRFELFYSGEWIELEGSFNFNDDELRVEIDILPKYEKDGFIVLWYDSMKMRDFEIIGSTYGEEEE